jgi:Flp pilus assembly protein TadG
MTSLNPFDNPAVSYVRMLASTHLARFAEARRRRDAGASAIELAIITAILVLLAVGVVAVIKIVVTNNCNKINANSGGSGGGTCP